ncbi:hypothetical protein [Winogradskyella rapida]|uniref:Uncharacterized protein n=1 Tax=Winogradskyella rapida TaxID=549701 RepID=A0ABW3KP81_9FLAO
MNISRVINTISIIVGGVLALYAQSQADSNPYVLIGGVSLLMFGIYRTSRNIPSKYDKPEESFVKTEKDHEV